MTREEFIKWLNKQIIHSKDNMDAQDDDQEMVVYWRGYLDAYNEVKEKFLTITPINEYRRTRQ
jgi:hypothetical protein